MKLTEKFFVLPSEIPFERLKDQELEECVYWLLDDMGAKELTWRIGGLGKGTADGGRDLEALFPIPSPDGEMTWQRWWIDPKGRRSTVEKSAVQDVVLNAQGRDDIDILVIATNTTFSNPTRDWVTETQKSRPRPKVRLWDRSDFERLLPRHPTAALRLFSKALSPTGRLEAASKKFWEFGGFTDAGTLSDLWGDKGDIDWDPRSYFSIIASEIAVGNIELRPWAATMENEALAMTFMNAMANVFYLVERTEAAGNEQFPLINATAHLLISCVLRFETDFVSNLLLGALSKEDGTPYPKEAIDIFFGPILKRAYDEMFSICSEDCERVCTSSSEDEIFGSRKDKYWRRFVFDPKRDLCEEDAKSLLLINTRAKCKIGFRLSEELECPLISLDIDDSYEISQAIEDLRVVANNRLGIAREEGKA